MKEPFIKRLIFERGYRLYRHLLFWFIILSVMTVLDVNERPNIFVSIEIAFVFAPVLIAYSYVIIYWLVPEYLLKGKYLSFLVLYACWVPIGLVMIFVDTYYVFYPLLGIPIPHFTLMEEYKLTFAVERFVRINLFAVFCVFIKFFKFWYLELQQKQQIEKEKMKAELQLLKSQLHPHFLFNTLNNLYSLVHEKSDKASPMLLRLSGLLSYVLYECKAEEVVLEKEISVIKDYVALERERYGERLEVSMNFSGDLQDRMIAPMLFQPFIENSFKHGLAEQLGKVWMSIELSVKDNELLFKIINSCNNNQEDEHKGIGINNVKKRLELLYPGKYNLEYNRQEDLFIVSLVIQLSTSSFGKVYTGTSPVKKELVVK
jgi:two-component system, LytTR family, sensor histidine kinase AlgZ